MQFGLIVQMTGLLGYPQPLVRLAREAEAAGWDGFFIWDVFGGDSTAPAPVVDPWIALAAIAATTERIRFGPMVTPLSGRTNVAPSTRAVVRAIRVPSAMRCVVLGML